MMWVQRTPNMCVAYMIPYICLDAASWTLMGNTLGKSARTFGESFKTYLKAPSLIFEHQSNTVHNITLEDFIIVGRKGHNFARTVKESIYIRANNPTLNRNIGKCNLPHIWDRVLFTIQ